MLKLRLLLFTAGVGVALLVVSPGWAEISAGDLFIVDANCAGDGAVVNMKDGGDLSAVPPFATGLSCPAGLCVDQAGRLLVAESASGEITVITAGGDMSGQAPLVTGLSNPAALACSGPEIMVAERATGEVASLPFGGELGLTVTFATGLGDVVGLQRDPAGRLWATDAAGGRLLDITAGGDFSSDPGYAFGGSSPRGVVAEVFRILVADAGDHRVADAVAGGDLATAPDFALSTAPNSMLWVEDLGLFAAGASEVHEIADGGDFVGAPPFAFGFNGSGYTGMAYVPGCGDGLIQMGEECDDSNAIGNDGCSAACRFEHCGDGIVQSDEDCDDGDTASGDGCSMACTLESCGDGVVQAIEDCDDANTNDGDGCDGRCRIETTEDLCGDGIVGASEACDDGNTVGGDGCSSGCSSESCGDGILQASESCDDGNTESGDGCASDCVSEVCGDGILQPFESCDDGNTDDGDGCSRSCQAVTWCHSTPAPDCLQSEDASLDVLEGRRGREKLIAGFRHLPSSTGVEDFGDPAVGLTPYELCLYDSTDALVARLLVDRAGDTCGTDGPCWKATRDGYRYKDSIGETLGVRKITARASSRGGRLKFRAANRWAKGQSALPSDIAGSLAGQEHVVAQLEIGGGACVSANLDQILEASPLRFKGRGR